MGGRYAHNTAGRADDLPGGHYFKSRSERNYARLLTFNKVRWEYEPKTFVFERVQGGKNRRYKPDFWLPDEGVFHEVKPYVDRDSAIKLRYMARYFPAVTVIVIPRELFQDVERQGLCRIIPHWECGHFPARLQTRRP